MIAQNNGTHVRPLGSGDESQISGDGARVAILSTTGLTDHCEFGPLRVVPSAGGAALAVPGNFCLRSLVWSPDSRRIAVVRVDSPTAETLLTADPATGSVSAIATGIFDRPSFSPDSTRLAYVQYPDASRLRRGGTLRVIGLATHVITTAARQGEHTDLGSADDRVRERRAAQGPGRRAGVRQRRPRASRRSWLPSRHAPAG